jgi:hypothetical protein
MRPGVRTCRRRRRKPPVAAGDGLTWFLIPGTYLRDILCVEEGG